VKRLDITVAERARTQNFSIRLFSGAKYSRLSMRSPFIARPITNITNSPNPN
jgi:hypothetical protein